MQMSYFGRIFFLFMYIAIVLGWHSFYFLADSHASYVFMFEKGQYKWDLLFIPLFSPFFWWLGLQYDKVKYLSQNDVLTGLFNRRYVEQITPKLTGQMAKKQACFTVSIIDCNNFKQINDTLGHKIGDIILELIAEVLMNRTKDADIVARWGGDEFLLISPYADLENTSATVAAIEMGLTQLSKKLGIPITISTGSAEYPVDADEMQKLIMIADSRMYEGKMQCVKVK
jgi:diguanylate cyclase (GGDEF)-like protein